jgi:hypothetical protein
MNMLVLLQSQRKYKPIAIPAHRPGGRIRAIGPEDGLKASKHSLFP